MTETIPAEVRQVLADMPAEARAELATLAKAIAALDAKRVATEARRAKAAAVAEQIQAAANAPELAAEPEIDAPSADRVNALIEGAQPGLAPHVQRAQRRKRNEERGAAQAQLRHDAEALAAEAARLAADIEDLDETLKRKRLAFLGASIRALAAAARRQMITYLRGATQIGQGVRDAYYPLGATPPVTIDDLIAIKVAFWRGDGSNNRDHFWPPSWNGRENAYRDELQPFDPTAALAAFEAALRDDAPRVG
ncbi:hypothetical protein [Elioraea sp.]|uniref:hypothetical protein n=1 Tax=Elioraea sp. TaxID=2185103 RepID=UPI003F71BD2F